MRIVSIHAPQGKGKEVAELVLSADISEVRISETTTIRADKTSTPADLVHLQTSTPKAKRFIESLLEAPFYNAKDYSFSIRHPESNFGTQPPEEETIPITRPTTDVYQELWQFCKLTWSLVGRVFLSAFLVAYGMKEGFIPLIIAGLLFLPYHHHLLGMGLGGAIGEGRLVKQAVLGFLVSTLLIMCGGMVMGLLSDPGIKWTAFTHTKLLFSFLISTSIGIAAGLGSVDDAGRRELIGLAATAHISVYPVWFGLKFIYGFHPSDHPIELLLVYLMDVATVVVFAGITYKMMKMKGQGIRTFLRTLTR